MKDDTISRRDAVEAMAELQGKAASKSELIGISKAWKRIKALPSAQQWIPTSEKLPEKENTSVITQTNAGSVIIDCVYGGTDVYGHHVWRDGKGGLYWDDEIVAWMPIVIPEPWKGDTP